MLPCLLRTPAANAARPTTTSLLKAIGSPRHTFTGTTRQYEKALPPRPKIPDTEIEEKFLKGTGPGGQKINKTSCAVQLRHLPTGIVVKSQETRSREQNRKFARNILAEKLDSLEKGDRSRSAIKAERAKSKKASAAKKSRRKYRKLEEEGKVGSQDVATDENDNDYHGPEMMADEERVEGETQASVPEKRHDGENDGKT
ncbi:hypothetical protein KC332_g5536 [Hortaea werneckii]|uniref:Prokaryotic-type class I peptide chain release factors domain-containing protein n=2 Tax=Hortaea werneckii TaxID=91943 RepID=A0A3M7I063_HORWE|nr:hypothetical protein KC358_g8204 [Hortaea werneckii]OTA38324.1 hypothetical protein BTJ68_01786 [Hortaea werneckii EXF-2000]KAI6828445.1 hypothetical protein KC350_g8063 [Hortaea werneckii]KAI6933088.1 hypothetical protein KC341_g8541 [Hortaea werneckii]KAI6937617.1 hypothetical protein KC348_g5701 [Hortaea werneckii]